ncbi:MAG: hydrogenase maturation nickel metallochaperone HypA [Candidatus Diapherotrites archaeon]|nr:hydrogenase maturation nickel metallochaperone HypA [Candidatus Diapherotrites archaeon]
MHEFSLAQGVVSAMLEAAGNRKVSDVHLRIGELTFISEEQLRFAIRLLSVGTAAEGCDVRIDPVSPEFECVSCGHISTADFSSPAFACGKCGADVRVLRGKEFSVDKVVLYD